MTTALASIQGALNPLKDKDPNEVLNRYLQEETLTEIAESYGVTRSGLNYWLLKYAEDHWKDAQLIRALKRKEEAETELDIASDTLTLARARERLKAAQWDLEKVCRRIYGSDVPADLSSRVRITINVAPQESNPQVTIDGETGQVTDK